MNGLKVAVLMGGIGEEREVSLESGKNIAKALELAGVDVSTSDVAPERLEVLNNGFDIFFLGLHGKFGEDGELQRILEARKLRYTGSGPEASKCAFDKMLSKQAFEKAGVRVAKAVVVDGDMDVSEIAGKLKGMGDRFVVKPIRQGSSFGITLAQSANEAAEMAKECFAQFGDCMIEQFIKGREFTVGIVCGRVLPIIEIRPKAAFYDYHAKYIDDKTEFLFDTISDACLRGKIEKAAIGCFEALGCRHYSRVDLIVNEAGEVFALEVNTLPGFTSHSLLPMAAAKAGIDNSSLCMMIADAAMRNGN